MSRTGFKVNSHFIVNLHVRPSSVNIKIAFHKGVRIGVKLFVSTGAPEEKLERSRPTQTPSWYSVTIECV